MDDASSWREGGSRSVEFGGEGASVRICKDPGYTRVIAIFDGQLYVSAASGEIKGIFAIGRGLSTAMGMSSSVVAPTPAVGCGLAGLIVP